MNQVFSDGSQVPDQRGICHAQELVARALAGLTQDQRLRVLLATAVLYGIIQPNDAEAVTPPSRARPTQRRNGGEMSIRQRVLEALEQRGASTVDELVTVTNARRETVNATLSKQVAAGETKRLGRGYYERVSLPISEGT